MEINDQNIQICKHPTSKQANQSSSKVIVRAWSKSLTRKPRSPTLAQFKPSFLRLTDEGANFVSSSICNVYITKNGEILRANTRSREGKIEFKISSMWDFHSWKQFAHLRVLTEAFLTFFLSMLVAFHRQNRSRPQKPGKNLTSDFFLMQWIYNLILWMLCSPCKNWMQII